MLIELMGMWVPNKGAELMAWTTIRQLRRRLPKAAFVAVAQGDYETRGRLGLRQLAPAKRRTWLDKLVGLQPAEQRHRYGLVLEHEITHHVDISGFAYGDFWGARKARDRAGRIARSGRPLYLLPQAFGPFGDPRLLEEMRRICTAAAIICARDAASLAHLDALQSGAAVELLPDITFSLDAADRAVERPGAAFACLVLNAKAVQAETIDAATMLALFEAAGTRLRKAGLTPVVLMHEPQQDFALSTELARRLGCALQSFDDARDLKAFIAGARLVVTARYHGLVNGLAAGIPSFAVGWSHKYRELLTDFGTPEACHAGDDAAFVDKLEAVATDVGRHAAQAERIRARLQSAQAQLEALWDRLAAHMVAVRTGQ